MSEHDIEARFTHIETKLSFAEDLLEDLNQLAFRQQATIERLEAALHQLLKRAQQDHLPGQQTRDLRDDIPPHY